jgi:hypothetical protein
MRNIFALIGLLVVGLCGVGWYMGWYKVNFTKNTDGSLQIKTDVDTQKMTGDSSAFFQKVGQIVNEKIEQNGQNGTQPPATTPANTPGNTTPPTGNPSQSNGQGQPSISTPTIPMLPQFPPDRMP